MGSIAQDSQLQQQMREWRRDIHAYPETAYEEHRTAAKVEQLLLSFDLEVHTGLAITGVVASLTGNLKTDSTDNPSIGLRADIDALNLQELNQFSHCSRHAGKMHACGHDGHTAMLLGAAKYLSEHRDFAGTVVFIFQPAEEGEAGAKLMCDEGLFERFNVDAVYGMHNWPGIEQGKFAVHAGPVMASMDLFDITIYGQGCHAGMPHLGTDPIMVAGQLISAVQSIVSRDLDPLHSGVVTITQMHGGEAYNIVPDSVTLSGTCRAFSIEQQTQIETLLRQRVTSICEAFGAKGELDYRKVAPCTENHPQNTQVCIDVTRSLVGDSNVLLEESPSMGSEDFAFMLLEKPGAYIWIGNGLIEAGKGLHNPHYDFNDDILALGANYWITLAQSQLGWAAV